MLASIRVPVATYRLQFNAGFRFSDARALVPYLHRLGITDLYASSLLTARPGSTHGYDVTDPLHLNPELGTEEEFEALVRDLKVHKMGLLLDIVPNHMAASTENAWWRDVLEDGPSSPYAGFFDIDWHPPTTEHPMDGKLVLPILGRPYREALERGELSLALDEQGLFVRYYDTRLPLDPKSYRVVLEERLGELAQALGQDHPAVQALLQLIEAIERLPERPQTAASQVGKRQRDKEAIKRTLWELYQAHEEARTFLDENVRVLNGEAGHPESFDRLDRLLAGQAYRLVFWRTGTREINYRRFFDINHLVGVRVEDPQVFEATHALILRLAGESKVTGLRVDHIDGLYDPADYLHRLQRRLAPSESDESGTQHCYVIVEKILTGDEPLPEEWPVAGTTGYDFLNTVNGVFVDPAGLEALHATYAEFAGLNATFADAVYQQKRRVVEELFEGELRLLARDLARLAERDPSARDIGAEDLARALVEEAACFPVYRTYVRDFAVGPRDRPFIEHAVDEARRRNPALRGAALDFLRRVLLLDAPDSLADEGREAWLRFVMRWQQFTGPATAKGLEDTALYVYNRLVSTNEVGADPDASGAVEVEAFHRRNEQRLRRRPHTLSATATHDTKRGEDVRARINVLSELPVEWARCLKRWDQMNRDKKRQLNGHAVPDSNEETLLYQTLIGAWPLDEGEVSAFGERLKAYVVKAAREAKVHTSWLDPDPEHERALTEFVDAVLSPSGQNEFLADFLQFQRRVAYHGAINSLAQVLLKIASPGVPDFYQGTELWDLSLVDPDNRRSVDFPKRLRLLDELQGGEARGLAPLVGELLARWQDGRVKLYLTAKALAFRRSHPDLFSQGDYLPLSASGRSAEHVVAFARRWKGSWALVAVPRLVTKLSQTGTPPVGRGVWGEDRLPVPGVAPTHWSNVLTGATLETTGPGEAKSLPLHALFADAPIALLSGDSIPS